SLFCVMIPEVCQYAALAAFQVFNGARQRTDIRRRVTRLLKRTIEGWTSLGWPGHAILRPSAGFKYLVQVPPRIEPSAMFSGAELFDYYVMTRAHVKLSTSKSFNPTDGRFIRLVLMQDAIVFEEVFRRLREVGVAYDMTLEPSVGTEFRAVVRQLIGGE